jgi:CotH kinase protein/Secretion system C-terminal sorting domain/Proprotein convertase P-domain
MRKSLLFLCYILMHRFGYAQIFTSTPNQVLQEGNTQTFTQNISGLPANQNNNFGLFEIDIQLLHAQTSEVTLALSAPDGTYIALSSYNGTGANFNHAKFRCYASQSIYNASAPINNQYMPINYFNLFQNNSDPNGIWTLHYYDGNTNSIVGTLQNWTLRFTPNPEQLSIDSMRCNLPIFNITVPNGIPNNPKTAGTIQIFNTGANSIMDVPTQTYNLGVETQGYTSSNGQKPNYDFEIRNATGAALNIPLLGLPAESDWIIKSGYTDQYMMKDPLTFEFSRRMGYYAPRTKHIELFINGYYQGIYILEEKIKRGANRVDIGKLKTTDVAGANVTGGYIFEINPNSSAADWYSNYLGYNGNNQTNNYEFKIVYPKKDSIQPAQKTYLQSYVDSFEAAMAGNNFQDTAIGWRKFVKEKTMIDFLIVSEYSMNYDTYGRSMYFSKEKSTKGNKINIGPPWDSDRGYEQWALNNGWVHITTHGYWTFPFWWVKARQDTLFEKKLACRFKTIRKYIMTDSAVNEYIDGMDILLINARSREILRWNKTFDPPANLKQYTIQRLNWMDTSLAAVVFPPAPLVSNINYINNPISINIGNNYLYNFRPGPDTSIFTPGVTGFYTAVIANQYGCETQKKFEVIIPLPLPIIDIALQGKLLNNTAKLSWQALSASTNVDLYELLHSVDGNNFTKICTKNNAESNYEIAHFTNAMQNFYKVKLYLKNGETQCSNTIVLQKSNSISEHVYPNPAKNVLYIASKTADKVAIYNMAGKLVLAQTQNTFEIDISKLQIGIYTVQITSGAEILSEQFVKE